MSSVKCWLCLRVTPRLVAAYCHKVIEYDKELAREISLGVMKILSEAYEKSPALVSSKQAKTLISGAIYYYCFKRNIESGTLLLTQREIAERLGLESDVSLRHGFHLFRRILDGVQYPLFHRKKKPKLKKRPFKPWLLSKKQEQMRELGYLDEYMSKTKKVRRTVQ